MSAALAYDPAMLPLVVARLEKELARRKEKAACEASLYEFFQCAWPSFDPAPFEGNWHLEAIAEHLEAVSNGDIRKLLINIPPRCGKTLMLQVAWPAWTWAQSERAPLKGPQVKFMCLTYSTEFATELSTPARRLLESEWYQGHWGDRFKIDPRQDNKGRFDTDKGGTRISTSFGGTTLGRGGDIKIIDDPIKPDEAESEVVRDAINRTYDETLRNRVTDPRTSAEVIIMQRLHDNDLSGHVLNAGEHVHLCLPMEFDERRRCHTVIGFEDPREEDGDLLWPNRFGEKELAPYKRVSYQWAGQYQQSPSVRGGNIIKQDYWRLYPPDGEQFDDRTGEPIAPLSYPPFDYVLVSVDTALTAKEENDWSACTCWGVYRNDNDMIRVLLIHAWQARLEFHDLVERVILTGRGMDKKTRRDGSTYEVNLGWHADTVLIENKANGLSVVQEMARLCRGEEFSIKVFDPRRDGGGDIVARAHSVEAMFEAGLVEAPDRDWANLVIDEVAAVPKGAHDDLASSAFQALKWLRSRSILLMRDEREQQLARELSPKAMRPMGKPYDV